MESRLHRRRVLQLASSGVLAWTFGPSLSGCARPSPSQPPSQAPDLAGAWDRARSARKPLLVLLADPSFPAQRGVEWSAYFELASDEDLAELSGCELAFATPEQVRVVFPSIQTAEPSLYHAMLVEPDGRTIRPVPVVRPEPDWTSLHDQEHSELLRPWIAQFEATLHAVLASSSSLARAASAAEVPGMARALRSRLREAAPAGGKWAKSYGGCGTVEFEDGSVFNSHGAGVACGMAHMPEKSRRFLWLYREGTS